jgi:hypothetical protein
MNHKFFVPHEIEAYLVLGNLVDAISPLGQQLFFNWKQSIIHIVALFGLSHSWDIEQVEIVLMVDVNVNQKLL